MQHPAGKAVAAEGEGALALHVVLDGATTVTVGGHEKRTLTIGDHFGEISLIDGKPRSATVTATEPLGSFLAVPYLVFQSLLDEDPTCARGLLTILCARLREAEASLGAELRSGGTGLATQCRPVQHGEPTSPELHHPLCHEPLQKHG